MDERALLELMKKVWKGDASLHEQSLFETWVKEHSHQEFQFDKMMSWEVIQEQIKEIYAMDDGAIRSKMRQFGFRPKLQPVLGGVQKRRWLFAAAAAVALLILVVNSLRNHVTKATTAVQPLIADVQPGRSRAILTLASGRKVTLDSSSTGTISHLADVDIVRSSAGSIQYKSITNIPLTATINSLETPPAGQFHLTLPDGSEVWLNNASRLTYPTSFDGADRQVELSGEAFFQIAKNPNKPFRVKVRDELVQVLGTSFNINSYSDEPAVATTLVDGAIAVDHKGKSFRLQPGYQARITEEGELKILPVSVEPIVAWKNGFFTFDESVDFAAAMRQLSRWYDVKVEYEGEIPHQVFYGTIDRQVALSQILKIFESKEYRLELEGRKLRVISPPSDEGK